MFHFPSFLENLALYYVVAQKEGNVGASMMLRSAIELYISPKKEIKD
jgi:hypothetical protein